MRLVLIVLGLLGMAVAWAQPGGRAAPVVVGEARLMALAPGQWVSARVRARHAARLAPESGGTLVEVAGEGTRVAQGAVVARLDDARERAELVAREAEVARLASRVAYLEKERRRLARLARSDSAAQTQLDQVSADLDQARAERRAAEARRDQARLALQRRTLRAPFAGVVSERLRRPGEWAPAGEAVVLLSAPVPLELVAAVPPGSARLLTPGRILPVRADDWEGQVAVAAVDARADETSALVTVIARLEDAPLLPGQPARLWVPTAPERERLAVPRDALVLRGGGAAVFVVAEDGSARRVPVRLGPAQEAWIAVSGEGLAAGDRVVVRGGERLRPGQKVRILDRPAP